MVCCKNFLNHNRKQTVLSVAMNNIMRTRAQLCILGGDTFKSCVFLSTLENNQIIIIY